MASEHDDLSIMDSIGTQAGINVPFGKEFSKGPWSSSPSHDEAAGSPTTAQIESDQSPSAAWPAIGILQVIETTEDDLRVVGSPMNRQAAAKRRKKHGIYQCLYRNAGCDATFTARHNLRHHLNAHMGMKPYKCMKCPYAASSPANTKRHQATCKAKERKDMVPKQDYFQSQELADIKLTDQFHFNSFGGNDVAHPGDGQDLSSFHTPANEAAGPPRLPPGAIPSPQSSVGSSVVRSPIINFDAVHDDILAAELSRIQQAADKRKKGGHDPNPENPRNGD